jgi:predicted anti-sigma-YlaC factor YlaD
VKRLSCQEVLDQLSDYLDEDARAELIKEVDGHLHECSHCQAEVDTIRRTIRIYRCDEKVMLPLSLSEKLQQALDQAYRATPRERGPLDV